MLLLIGVMYKASKFSKPAAANSFGEAPLPGIAEQDSLKLHRIYYKASEIKPPSSASM
ncbi:MAG: hypothetical protein LPK09_04210 [Hymenobacteraceae bacterium]|nr:hypothetical protein [Hymenobacteraceae bacterium]